MFNSAGVECDEIHFKCCNGLSKYVFLSVIEKKNSSIFFKNL